MSGRFNENGVQFLFPENWTMIDDAHSDAVVDVMVQAPGGAFWTLQAFDGGLKTEDLLDTALESLGEEYEDLEASPYEIEIGTSLGVGYDLSFFCLDFLVTGKLLAFVNDERVYLVLYQAEQKDFDEFEAVFQAITTSLIGSEKVVSSESNQEL